MKALIDESCLKSRKIEARFLLKKCFANKVFSLVPFEIWRDFIVLSADLKTIVILSQTCYAFKEIVENIGENNFNLALMLRSEGQIDLARKYLLLCANNNNSTAMFHLAQAYFEFGWGLNEKNLFKADEWFEKAGKSGNSVAMAYLALRLKGLLQVSLKRVDSCPIYRSWAKKALSSNNSLAVGVSHYAALATEVDYVKAFGLFEKSAKEGDEFGQEWLGHCFYYGLGCERNYEKSFFWRLKSAKQGSCKGQQFVSEMYFNGEGCAKDPEKAIFWCKRSAKQGHTISKLQLGEIMGKEQKKN